MHIKKILPLFPFNEIGLIRYIRQLKGKHDNLKLKSTTLEREIDMAVPDML